MIDDRDDPWTEARRARWRAIEAHAFEDAAAPLDFTAKLAREHGWSRAEAQAAIREYRRFCFLSTVTAGTVVPSDAVDAVWHLHLCHSEDYWLRFCPDVLGFAFHHRPAGRDRGDGARLRVAYADTLADYERWFGPPSSRWWPGTDARFRESGRKRWVDRAHYWLIPKPGRGFWGAAMAAVATTMLTMQAHANDWNPLDWHGPSFLALFLVLMVVSLIAAGLVRRGVAEPGAAMNVGVLDASAIAWLVGGAPRVLDRTAGELLGRGLARFDAATQRIAVDAIPADFDPVAREIAQSIATHGSLADAESRLASVALPARDALVRRGFWHEPGAARQLALRSAIAPGLVLAFGLAKIAVGMARDRPVAFLVVLCVMLAAIVIGLCLIRPGRTGNGRAALAELRRRHARAMRAPREREWGLAIALAGTAVLSGTAAAAYHGYRQPATSDSSTSSSSDSSGDSGGGDSGGGCGGCGGGGD